jgi:Ankyrin repeats (3 copies)
MSRTVAFVAAVVVVLVVVPLVLSLMTAEKGVRFDESLLHVGAKNGDMGRVETALESGADINARDESGKTALHYAAENGHSQTTGFLLSKGADAGMRDAQGHTALDLARSNNHGQTAGVLAKATGAVHEVPQEPERQTLNPSLKYPDLASFEATIGQPACLLKSDHVWLFAPRSLEKEACIVHEYLVRAYDALYEIVGVDTQYITVVYNFPKGHKDAFGGTSNCTIWYDDTNLRFEQHEEWREYKMPHVSGYIEEMAHNFNYTQFGWEMVGWSIGVTAAEQVAGNPIFARELDGTRRRQAETFERYKALGNTLPADMEPNLVDRIHAHLLWQCEQAYGPTFWTDFFRESKKERARLRTGNRDERYRITIECLDRLPGVDFKQMLQENGISLTTDVKSLNPTEPGWNRKLE